MKEKWKKAGIIAGHVICIVIIICCVVYSQTAVEEKKNDNQQVSSGAVVIMPTEEPINVQQPTITEIPSPTVVITQEAEVMEIPIPTEEITSTETPVPTVEITPTETPTLTKAAEPTDVPAPTEIEEAEPAAETAPTENPQEEALSGREAVKQQVLTNISGGIYQEMENNKNSWWFRRKNDHVPSGSGQAFDISEYQGYYLNNAVEDGDKVIYMTIDCGYGSSHTPLMLDIFKKHDIKVLFFVTKFFIDANPQYVRRMVEEGHLVGNHSVSHADLTSLSDEDVYNEIIGCEEAFYNVTGKQMDLYFRPPEGAYSKRTMQITEDLGYKTIFWSIAYNDYDKKNQPGKAFVVDHFTTYHHSGAIPLMHNDSTSNLEAMDDVLTLLEEQGYRFGTLNELK